MGKHSLRLWYMERGRGDSIRMLLRLAEVDFEEVCIDAEQWPAKKNETPFGQVLLLNRLL